MDQSEVLKILKHYNEHHPTPAEISERSRSGLADDMLDQELAETFPASDPLSFWSG